MGAVGRRDRRARLATRRESRDCRRAPIPTSATRRPASASGGNWTSGDGCAASVKRHARNTSPPKRPGTASSRRWSPTSAKPISRCARSISSWTSPGARGTRPTDGLRLTEARRTSGVASGLDVRQAEQLLFTADRADCEHRARDRAGRERTRACCSDSCPATCRAAGRSRRSQAPPAVPAGLPSALLERTARHPPGRTGARRRQRADRRRQGGVLPAHQPHGLPRRPERALTDLLSGPAVLASASAGAAVPIFNAGRTRGNVQARGGDSSRSARELPAGRCTPRFATCRTGSPPTRRLASSADNRSGWSRRSRESSRLATRAVSQRARQLPARARRAAKSLRR